MTCDRESALTIHVTRNLGSTITVRLAWRVGEP